MTLSGLLTAVAADPALARAVREARDGASPTLELAAPAPVRPFAVAALAAPAPLGAARTVLAVTATGREAEDLVTALGSLLGPDNVAHFPSWETLPHERLSPRSDTVGLRLAVLRRLAHPSADDPSAGPVQVVVAPVRSVLQPLVRGLGDLEPVSLRPGDELALDDAVERLAAAAYTRVDMVEKRGEFAVRGGILDVFPPTEEHPLRVEYWGDTVEEVRWFKVADQRSLEVAEHGLWAPPCRELLLTPEVRERARALGAAHPSLAEVVDKLAEGIAVEGMEALIPALVDDLELLPEAMPAGTYVVVCDPERVRARAADLVATSREFLDASWATAAAGGEAPIDLGASSYRDLSEVRATTLASGRAWWTVTPFDTDLEISEAENVLPVSAKEVEGYRGDVQRAIADAKGWLGEGWRVVYVTEGHGPAERTVERLKEAGVPARLDVGLRQEPSPGVAEVTTGCIEHGLVSAQLKLAILTETDVNGQKASTKDMRRMPSRRRNQVDPLQLKPGDPVVHEHHGVGRYVEMVQRTVQGATREYLVIEYAPSKRGAPGDRLFVPTDQLDLVTRYVGGEQPALDRMGGADWQKRKGRAKKAVKQIAAELIKLYSARMATQGHQFGPDTPWQRELEDAFPYAETPDQLSTIDEVKRDMERPVPMDRVVCGDVGYGKTEIAVRAAFKAVMEGKQVAVLVPTTLLVQQHYSTFSERYAGFPVNVKALSRFQTDKEAKAVQEGVRDGSVDVVIGTHRLIMGDVHFKDLGLVIVDEEQRFGVEHKERLKHLRTNVDVLTMSATPIPRTLEMSITGIREMSTILTPPEERHPVLTYVGAYDEKQISAAIRRELLREGQVFYIHNRVESIERASARLRELVPEARVAHAHGQMNEHQLEQVVLDFWERRVDVLVCTTIVESGLNISNANTLIVERGDTLGLSQLHQLRGRVGRGRERAYAYFLYPPEKPLTETAHDRLATIAQNSDLGAGMRVAMKDLEIRGAGNLLGGEQSGHIADVGFDLYVRLVGEAVAEFKGEADTAPAEVKVELPVDAHLPHDYVPGERLRLEAYRKLAEAADDEAIEAVKAELADRYGTPPEPVENLVAVARFRAHARTAGLRDVALQGSQIRFGPVELRESQQLRLQRLYPRTLVKPATSTILVPRPATARIGGSPLRDVALLDWCRDLIDAVLLDAPAPAAAGGSGR
ncbi:transcription-repair coupling factor [Motilibacter aurantiacus]|uniref:transcription-repair coupling factor n=1 Tax=Motilibacter aurantiacus TaxID=2714955 RepID=UPI001409E589|nr:transcription-repair coupling factor [Motilibacter aurantiacus]